MQLRDCPHECETAVNRTEVGLRSCEERLVKTKEEIGVDSFLKSIPGLRYPVDKAYPLSLSHSLKM